MRRGGSGRRPEPSIVDIATHPRACVCLRVAGEYLGLSWRTVQARIEAGDLAGVRDGRRWSVPLRGPKGLEAYGTGRTLSA